MFEMMHKWCQLTYFFYKIISGIISYEWYFRSINKLINVYIYISHGCFHQHESNTILFYNIFIFYTFILYIVYCICWFALERPWPKKNVIDYVYMYNITSYMYMCVCVSQIRFMLMGSCQSSSAARSHDFWCAWASTSKLGGLRFASPGQKAEGSLRCVAENFRKTWICTFILSYISYISYWSVVSNHVFSMIPVTEGAAESEATCGVEKKSAQALGCRLQHPQF